MVAPARAARREVVVCIVAVVLVVCVCVGYEGGSEDDGDERQHQFLRLGNSHLI
jgi:hypothetical protein